MQRKSWTGEIRKISRRLGQIRFFRMKEKKVTGLKLKEAMTSREWSGETHKYGQQE